MNRNTEALAEGIKDYLSTNSELLKLEATQESSEVVSMMISGLIIGLLAGLFFLFASVSVGFYFSTILGNHSSGFAMVAGFYLLIGAVLYLGRKRLLESPICNMIIRLVLRKTQ
ncbi:MAG: phage holin family protein [Bacteroidia bacterium]|nr:phage holin family protein [Bacteroidia bacterium]